MNFVKECPLGKKWFEIYYRNISESLDYSEERDASSRDALSAILSAKEIIEPDTISGIFENRIAVMFGAGPSLESDLRGLMKFLKESGAPVVAADGAADALYEAGVVPALTVSDLDSCSVQNLEKNSREGFVFAHAHGDNANLIEKIVPKLDKRVFGTTQVGSVDHVLNFGGLTDGDRACFATSAYNPRAIVIAGMDYGVQEGLYSKSRYGNKMAPLRPVKLALGKKSLEFLVANRKDILFYNVTKYGEEIIGTKRLNYSEATSIER